jgi:uncharacterized Zn-binding protein involved in type VI secretion
MSAYLLHENATVLCVHPPGGQAKPAVTDQRVKVSGKKIVTQPSIYNISGCTLPTQSGGPCVTAQWTSAATRVKVSGMPVLFKDGQAKCAPTGTGLNIVSTQTRVKVT